MKPQSTFAQSLATLLISSLMLPVSEAHACAPPACQRTVVAPAEGAIVPTNIPGFPVEETGLPAQLLDANANVVPASVTSVKNELVNYKALVPDAPLLAGSYSLRYAPGCGNAGTLSRAFKVEGTARPITTLGNFEPENGVVVNELIVSTASGSCTSEVKAAVASVGFTPSSELVPYLPVARFLTTVDGQWWASTKFGDLSPQGIGNPMDAGARSFNKFFMSCGTLVDKHADRGLGYLPDGKHKVTIALDLPGAKGSLPVHELEIEIDSAKCELRLTNSAFESDNPTPGQNKVPSNATKAGTPASGSSEADDSAQGGGCSMTRTPTSRKGTLFGMFVCFVALGSAVRRRGRAHAS